ncbi:M20 metallopeptidase family protein [Fusobacterium necrophorum]|uniref:Amidohydrolase n=3 Tax=Fusobacterium necrophorum TaxID=859 RepID=A0AAN4ASB4_9FUSO|nr:M20 family metallopeptidase [Fusobacterium necrophorum]AYV95353.1 amidohydrolase [Fusobacterium necrophorum subsp. funduliforme]EFS23765.1 amidohydrolase [Fusobacterium necrophorum D12]EJU15620.1 amidohydrolase [Fusobacterium necrophorum subsp. funduliforme Fnf 1007]KYL00080.1 N-acyl-L-amino acid amidohydrolase [Fusobacterium necrophorum subsp. funduliforme]KYL01687.1 N-acyl-L-amino acid amidohydrolase [Fusobacterium necrophorum subsp. funduliforme]
MGVLEDVKALHSDMIQWRRDLHQIPELNLELPKTVAYLKRELESMGITYNTLVSGNAIVAVISGEKGKGKTIGLRADMDALPIPEETNLDFAAKNGCMHACGHDGHMAMLLGAAKYFSTHRSQFYGNIKLLFQPGEEYPGGALPMIEEGAMENPHVDAVMGLHEGIISEEIPVGSIGYRDSCMMASMDRFLIKVIGKGCHGAYPQMGVDPILLASQVVTALQGIVSREIKATEPAIVSVCRIQGGYCQNIIPDVVELEGTVRATNENTRKFLAERIESIVKNITAAARGSYEIEYEFKYPVVMNDKKFTQDFLKSARKILKEEQIYQMEAPVLGGEDMAYFLQKAPGTFFFLSNPKIYDDGKIYSHHNPKFDVNEDHFVVGAALFVQAALDFLNGEEA